MAYFKVLLKCASSKLSNASNVVADWAQSQKGFLGFEELGHQSTSNIFDPPPELSVLEFGSRASELFDEWVQNEARTSDKQGPLYFRVYFECLDGQKRPELSQAPEGIVVVSVETEEPTDYLENFRKTVKGQDVGQSFWVGPEWETPTPGRHTLFIEPGMAFGTGDHPTSQMCLEFLEELAHAQNKKLSRVADIGTGTGILAAGLLKLLPTVDAAICDLDPLCAAEVEKTFAKNNIQAPALKKYFGPSGTTANLLNVLGPSSRDTIISNIYAEVLMDLAGDFHRLLSKGGLWVASGILQGPPEDNLVASLKDIFVPRQRKTRTSRESETWVAYVFERV